MYNESNLEKSTQIADSNETLIVRVESSKSIDVQSDLVLGKVNRHILTLCLQIQTHLKIKESHSPVVLLLKQQPQKCMYSSKCLYVTHSNLALQKHQVPNTTKNNNIPNTSTSLKNLIVQTYIWLLINNSQIKLKM